MWAGLSAYKCGFLQSGAEMGWGVSDEGCGPDWLSGAAGFPAWRSQVSNLDLQILVLQKYFCQYKHILLDSLWAWFTYFKYLHIRNGDVHLYSHPELCKY